MSLPDVLVLNLRTTSKTLGEAIDIAQAYGRAHRDMEVFLDGDTLSIMARPWPGRCP